jgi:mRNA-degrading endonuclease RelE of RelBE toxin-antitoxin system
MKDREIEKKIKKEVKEYEAWENSLEGILYNMKVWADIVDKRENPDKLVVAKTLQKLPKEVREKVLEEVTFLFVNTKGIAQQIQFNKLVEKKNTKKIGKSKLLITITEPVIFLNFSLRESEKNKMNTTAHEIAHFVLNHHKNPNNYSNEKAADDLSVKWGFKRCYTKKAYKELEERGKKNS